MANMYLERLLTQREELRADAKNILDKAAGDERDVTDVEREAVEASYRDIADLDKKIQPLHEAELRQVTHDQMVADLQRTQSKRREATTGGPGLEYYRGDVGRYLADWGAKARGDKAAQQRIMRAQAEYRVVADQKLADNPGIVPTVIVDPLVGTLPSARPFVDSVANRPMPGGGSSFNRPRITQHAAVGLQATEKTQLASQKLTIDSINVPKKTFGGTLDISFQDRDWTDPAILSIAVSDLQAVYANETDNAAADASLAATTQTFVLADGAAEGPVRTAFLVASSSIFASIKQRPDTVWMSPDEYAWYASLTTAGGVVAFPGLSDATGAAGTMMGLRVVVDGNFAAKTTIIGVASQTEHYEQTGGLLAVTEPTILGYTIAYYGYVADVLLQTGANRKRSAT